MQFILTHVVGKQIWNTLICPCKIPEIRAVFCVLYEHHKHPHKEHNSELSKILLDLRLLQVPMIILMLDFFDS